MKLIKEKDANIDWIIRFTYLLNKEHFIFAEGYQPPKNKEIKSARGLDKDSKFSKYKPETFANIPLPNRGTAKARPMVSGYIARTKKPTALQVAQEQLA